MKKQKDLLKACDNDINNAVAEQRSLQKEHGDSELKIKEMEHKISKGQKESQDAARQVTN